MTESTWGKPENWIGSAGGGALMSLMTVYDNVNPYAVDLVRESYMPIARLLSRSLCPKCSS